MEDALNRVARGTKGSKKRKEYSSFDELRQGVATNSYKFIEFVRNVLSDTPERFDYLMALDGKRFIFELRIFAQRLEKARNERDKKAASR
jgi:hypothetical protein